MTIPESFVVHHVDRLHGWAVRDDLVERLWLPLVGPTPYCLLRLIHADLQASAGIGWGEHVEFPTATTGERLGVSTRRCFESVLRLERFRLIECDDIDSTYDRPVFILGTLVPVMGPKQWRRLAASVREREAGLVL